MISGMRNWLETDRTIVISGFAKVERSIHDSTS